MLRHYYNLRAKEYEEIYHRSDPIRQKEQAEIVAAIKDVLANRYVLEIACGTGFWTAIAAETAKSITAIDTSEEMLTIARAKSTPSKKVEFCNGDAYTLDSIKGKFDAGLSNFWLSHVPKTQLENFLHNFHKKLGTSAVVFMADNVYIPGFGGELIEKLECKDTFKSRALSDGSKHEVLKNYYDENQLYEIFGPFSLELKIKMGNCFWWVNYSVR